MNYLESKPSAISEQFVKLFWELSYGREEMSGIPEPVLPDGCVEIIFDFRDPFVTYISETVAEVQPRSIIAGQMTSRLMIGPSGVTDMFGVRLHSEAAFPLFGISMAELRDQIIDLKDAIGRTENELFEKLANAEDFAARIKVFEEYLFTFSSRNVNAELRKCVSALRATNGSISVARCALELGWSERRLERTFNEQIGLSPKLFARIIRFQSFIAAAGTDDAALLDKVFAAGYYDQSHMIKDFRNFAGVSPKEYFGRDLKLSGLFLNT